MLRLIVNIYPQVFVVGAVILVLVRIEIRCYEGQVDHGEAEQDEKGGFERLVSQVAQKFRLHLLVTDTQTAAGYVHKLSLAVLAASLTLSFLSIIGPCPVDATFLQVK